MSQSSTAQNSNSGRLIPAATVLLLRQGAQGMEVFMVARHHQIDFVGGALVFPGGKVDKGDTHEAVRARIDGVDGLDDYHFSMRVAAIREAYEECGVLLARDDATGALIAAARLKELEAYRQSLSSGETKLGDFLEKEGLRLAADLLVHFAHWITPEYMPKRFDTHFYLAAAPEDHVAIHDGMESVDSLWVRPADAIREADEGKHMIIFPTRVNVLKVGRHNVVADAIAAARTSRIMTVLPKLVRDAEGGVVRIPVEADYDVIEDRIPPEQLPPEQRP